MTRERIPRSLFGAFSSFCANIQHSFRTKTTVCSSTRNLFPTRTMFDGLYFLTKWNLTLVKNLVWNRIRFFSVRRNTELKSKSFQLSECVTSCRPVRHENNVSSIFNWVEEQKVGDCDTYSICRNIIKFRNFWSKLKVNRTEKPLTAFRTQISPAHKTHRRS